MNRDSRLRHAQVLSLQRAIGNRATARALVPNARRRLQRMLWVIEPKKTKEKKELSEEFAKDLERLQGSAAAPIAASEFQQKEVSFTREHASQSAAHVHRGGTLHLLSHAGLVDKPWIGGMYYDRFATSLVSKYPSGALEGSTIWLLVCWVGQKIDELLAALKAAGLQNITVYAPRSLMFISQRGIPHVHHDDDADYDELKDVVAKYDAEFESLSTEGFLGTGPGWAGGRLVAGKPERLKTLDVENAVKNKFDPEGDEE